MERLRHHFRRHHSFIGYLFEKRKTKQRSLLLLTSTYLQMTKTFKEWCETNTQGFKPNPSSSAMTLTYGDIYKLVDEYISECAPLRTKPTNGSLYTTFGVLQVLAGALMLDGYDMDDACVKMVNMFAEQCNNEGEYVSNKVLTNPENTKAWIESLITKTDNDEEV